VTDKSGIAAAAELFPFRNIALLQLQVYRCDYIFWLSESEIFVARGMTDVTRFEDCFFYQIHTVIV
jgi:hypothetical protein